MKGCDHRNLSAVLKRRSESTLLLARRISLLIFTKRATGSPEPFGSSSPITFCMNWSLTCKSCTVYFGCSFFGNWNTIGLMLSEKRAIDKIFRRRDRYDIPDWQRQEVWNREKKQRLIDSILRGWKLPKFYFIEGVGENYLVEDGQQRLNAIWEFFSNELPLSAESA